MLNADQPANAVHGTVSFPLEYISVISVNYNNSIVDLWVRKPSFSNFGVFTGNVTFEGVMLNPGFTGSDGKIVNIIFRVKKQGSASVKMADLAILANDGLGTNIASNGGEASFVFTSPLPPGPSKSTTEEKLNTIEEKVKKIEEQTKLEPFIQEVNFYHRVINLWEIVPFWAKFIAIILGGTIVILALFALGLIIAVIIWIWNHVRQRHPYNALKNFSRKLLSLIVGAEHEIESDITYGRLKFEENYHDATEQIPIRVMLKNYFSRVWSVIKRFFTNNTKLEDKTSEDKLDDQISEDKLEDKF